MASDYLEDYRRDAKEIVKTHGQVKEVIKLLESDKVSSSYEDKAEELLNKVEKALVKINSAIQSLVSLEEDSIIKTDATFVNLRTQLIGGVERAKGEFAREIVPELEKLTKQIIESSKQNLPEQVNESVLPPPPSGEHWTVQKVLDTASQLVDQATKAGTIIMKAYPLAKALGLLLGLPIP
jgi:hypothetical protein